MTKSGYVQLTDKQIMQKQRRWAQRLKDRQAGKDVPYHSSDESGSSSDEDKEYSSSESESSSSEEETHSDDGGDRSSHKIKPASSNIKLPTAQDKSSSNKNDSLDISKSSDKNKSIADVTTSSKGNQPSVQSEKHSNKKGASSKQNESDDREKSSIEKSNSETVEKLHKKIDSPQAHVTVNNQTVPKHTTGIDANSFQTNNILQKGKTVPENKNPAKAPAGLGKSSLIETNTSSGNKSSSVDDPKSDKNKPSANDANTSKEKSPSIQSKISSSTKDKADASSSSKKSSPDKPKSSGKEKSSSGSKPKSSDKKKSPASDANSIKEKSPSIQSEISPSTKDKADVSSGPKKSSSDKPKSSNKEKSSSDKSKSSDKKKTPASEVISSKKKSPLSQSETSSSEKGASSKKNNSDDRGKASNEKAKPNSDTTKKVRETIVPSEANISVNNGIVSETTSTTTTTTTTATTTETDANSLHTDSFPKKRKDAPDYTHPAKKSKKNPKKVNDSVESDIFYSPVGTKVATRTNITKNTSPGVPDGTGRFVQEENASNGEKLPTGYEKFTISKVKEMAFDLTVYSNEGSAMQCKRQYKNTSNGSLLLVSLLIRRPEEDNKMSAD